MDDIHIHEIMLKKSVAFLFAWVNVAGEIAMCDIVIKWCITMVTIMGRYELILFETASKYF